MASAQDLHLPRPAHNPRTHRPDVHRSRPLPTPTPEIHGETTVNLPPAAHKPVAGRVLQAGVLNRKVGHLAAPRDSLSCNVRRETSVMSPTVRARATARPATTWAQHATRGSLKTSTGLYHGLSPLRRWAVCSRIQSPPLRSPQAAPSAPAFPERPTSAPQPSAPHDRTQPAFPGCLKHAHCPLAPPPHPNATQKPSEAVSSRSQGPRLPLSLSLSLSLLRPDVVSVLAGWASSWRF